MKQLTMTALTDEGEKQLRAIKAKTDIPLHDRFIYKRMYDERILKEKPFTLRVTFKNAAIASMVEVKDLLGRFEVEMERRGAERGIDYTIEGE